MFWYFYHIFLLVFNSCIKYQYCNCLRQAVCIESLFVQHVLSFVFVSYFKVFVYLHLFHISKCLCICICFIIQNVCVFVFVWYFKMFVYLYLYDISKCLCICICMIIQNGQINLLTLFSELKAVLIVNPHFLTKARAKSNSS